MATATIDANEMMKSVVLHVKLRGMHSFRFRLWLATKLIYFAALVLGCGLEVQTGFTGSEEGSGEGEA